MVVALVEVDGELRGGEAGGVPGGDEVLGEDCSVRGGEAAASEGREERRIQCGCSSVSRMKRRSWEQEEDRGRTLLLLVELVARPNVDAHLELDALLALELPEELGRVVLLALVEPAGEVALERLVAPRALSRVGDRRKGRGREVLGRGRRGEERLEVHCAREGGRGSATRCGRARCEQREGATHG